MEKIENIYQNWIEGKFTDAKDVGLLASILETEPSAEFTSTIAWILIRTIVSNNTPC
jgi:hypothetical protein